jgi:hypothetical protein
MMSTLGSRGRRADRDPDRRIKQSLLINLVACLALVAQFLLGMVVNLFVTIPEHHPGAHAKDFFAAIPSTVGWVIPNGSIWLASHVTLGLVLLVAGLANAAWAPYMKRKLYTTASVLGGLGIIGAAFNGISFVNYGHDFSSMIMAGLWALALSCYLLCSHMAAITRHEDISGTRVG